VTAAAGQVGEDATDTMVPNSGKLSLNTEAGNNLVFWQKLTSRMRSDLVPAKAEVAIR